MELNDYHYTNLDQVDYPQLQSFLSHPQGVLSSYSDACYDEAQALELEEALVRRICAQGQMGALPPVAIRKGTGYLTLRHEGQGLGNKHTYTHKPLNIHSLFHSLTHPTGYLTLRHEGQGLGNFTHTSPTHPSAMCLLHTPSHPSSLSVDGLSHTLITHLSPLLSYFISYLPSPSLPLLYPLSRPRTGGIFILYGRTTARARTRAGRRRLFDRSQ